MRMFSNVAKEITCVQKKIPEKYIRESSMIRGPKFLVRLKSHTVFENTPIKLFCTVEGYPTPHVKVCLFLSLSLCVCVCLSSCRCGIDDTAMYTAVASNSHGQASSQASIIVKSESKLNSRPLMMCSLETSYQLLIVQPCHFLTLFLLRFSDAILPEIKYTKINITFLETFNVTFGKEEDCVTLACKMTISPNLANLQPDALWYRDEHLLKESKWAKMESGGGVAKLTLTHLAKDDEGLYTLRMVTKGGDAVHSAYVFVEGTELMLSCAPRCSLLSALNLNRIYYNTISYFKVSKCEKVGTENWTQCNDSPIKICKYPVPGLFEGHSYYFRVRAVNSHGISRPSRVSEPIAALDPTEFERLHGVPSAPGQVVATRETDTSVLIQWAPPKEPNNLIGYYIDSCVKGSKDWDSANHKPNKKTKFVVHGLKTGETYVFRVQAINELGLSEESQESAPLSVRAALKLPSAPYDIALLYCDGESMVLNWKRPAHSGGAEVTDYYIDRCNVAKKAWKEVNVPPIKERLYKVPNLTPGSVYQFRVYGANVVGLGNASTSSPPFKCEAWTMPEPGPPYDLSFIEIRDDSLVVEWKPPVYTGASAVTGYYVDMCKKGTETWTTANAAAVDHCYLKVKGLQTGSFYVFRVRAENAQGTGKPSVPSDRVCAKTLPGSQEIKCGVDEQTGDIYLSFESCQMAEISKFVWKKSYQEITDFSKGLAIKTSGSNSTLLFKNPDKEDVGTFSVAVTHTDGVSASYKITAEELAKMLTLSYDIRNPIIPLKTELAYKILERGRVRFWLQAEAISSAVTYKFFANNKELVNCEQTKMSHDVATGTIEMVLDHFTEDSEGTYAVQIQDGRGKAQSSLVLIGDAFKAALAEAEYQRREYIRVKEGTELYTVANLKKESAFHWFKNDVEVIPEVPADLGSGVCKLLLSQFSKKDVGVYKATISDDRGQDVSQVDISGKVFDNIINDLTRVAGASAADLVIHCTSEGIMLQCYMKYYTEEMKITWAHKDSKITASERMRVSGTPAMATLEIVEPTEKDKGVYTFEIKDSEKTNTRHLELSGQGALFWFSDRGKVVGGLPDVVTIMEKKTLSLTCTVCGDPKPQVTWSKNDQEVEPGDQYVISLDSGKFASLTIKGVTLEDSGKFTMAVLNKYGGESVDIVVSVYKHGDRIPEIKPSPTPKRIMPPTMPIVIPTAAKPASAPAAAPAKSPAPAPKSPAPSRSVRSPTPSRRK
uniref:Myomesin 2 n=1 Tax=Astyanax mexicanus TaxID=7994 RepID=A0A8B9JNG1_ASTMX